MPPLTNTRWETFTQNWFEGTKPKESAIIAGYAPKWASSIGTRLSKNVKIWARYNELQEQAASKKVLTKQQRMEILSEIASGNLMDYQEVGADGGYLSIGKESPNTRAISELTSRTEYDKNGTGAALVTKVKLHNPVNAIDLLCKIDGTYHEAPPVNIDNRTINITVMDETTQALVGRVLKGERTSKQITEGGIDV